MYPLKSGAYDDRLQVFTVAHRVQHVGLRLRHRAFDDFLDVFRRHDFFQFVLNHWMMSSDSYIALPSMTRHGTCGLPPILTSSSRAAGLSSRFLSGIEMPFLSMWVRAF